MLFSEFKTRVVWNAAGLVITEATYIHKGARCCARLRGLFTLEQFREHLILMRKMVTL